MKTIFIIITLLISSIICTAQKAEIKWGKEQEHTSNQKITNLLKSTNDAYYILSKKLISESMYGDNCFLNPVLEKYNNELNLVKSLDLNRVYKAKCQVINAGGNLYTLTESRNKAEKLNVLRATKINDQNLTIEDESVEISSLPYESLAFVGEFEVFTTTDHSKIAVLSKKYQKTQLTHLKLEVFDTKWNLLNQNYLELPTGYINELAIVKFTDDGCLYALIKQNRNIKNKAFADYLIYEFSPNKRRIKSTIIQNQGVVLENPQLVFEKNKLYLFSNKNRENNLVIADLNFRKKKSATSNYSIHQIIETVNNKSANTLLKKVISNSDGFYLFFEQDASSAELVEKNKQITMGSISAVKMNFNHEIIWSQTIEKNQASSTSVNQLSFSVFEDNNQLLVFFNDNQANFKKLALNKQNGEIIESKILEKQSFSIPTSLIPIKENSFLLNSKQDNSSQLGFIK